MDAVEREVEHLVGVTGVSIGKADKNMDGVHVQAVGLSLVLAPDGCDDVTREVQGSRGCMGGRADGESWGRTWWVRLLG